MASLCGGCADRAFRKGRDRGASCFDVADDGLPTGFDVDMLYGHPLLSLAF